MKSIEIYLIRHGKTYCNERHLYCGHSDIDLSEKGIREIKEKKYKLPQCELYFTSGLKRTNKTLKLLNPDAKFTIIKELCEYNFGQFELKGYDDIKDIEEYKKWINDETLTVKCPDGESRSEFFERVEQGFKKIISLMNEKKMKRALGVVHGGVIGIILEKMYDNSKKFYEYQPPNGEGYVLHINVDNNSSFKISDVENIKF